MSTKRQEEYAIKCAEHVAMMKRKNTSSMHTWYHTWSIDVFDFWSVLDDFPDIKNKVPRQELVQLVSRHLEKTFHLQFSGTFVGLTGYYILLRGCKLD